MKISHEELIEHVSYDPETGIFRWRRKDHGRRSNECGSINNQTGYVYLCINRKRLLGHRAAWLYVKGSSPEGQIDHINGCKTDNRISNLRDVSRSTNQQNRRKAGKGNKCGLLGAHSTAEGKFTSRIVVGKDRVYLGYFDTAEQAHEAYIKAKRQYHEGCML